MLLVRLVGRGSNFTSKILGGLVLLSCLALSACSDSTLSTTEDTPEDTTSVPAYASTLQPQIEEKMSQLRIPGAIIYIDVPGEGTWTTALGTGDLATGAPISLDDHFRIGSNTKTFTGTVVLQLVDEGKLGLDDPVSDYQPEVPNGENITIRQLLNMSSGLFNYSEDEEFNETLDAQPDKVWEPRELVEIGFQHQRADHRTAHRPAVGAGVPGAPLRATRHDQQPVTGAKLGGYPRPTSAGLHVPD
jgi:D-alanyl-D-alanine carboxypeptidase